MIRAWILVTKGLIEKNAHKILTPRVKDVIIILMFDYLLNYQEKNGRTRPRVHYWKWAFHILINNIRIILNDYSAGIVSQKKYCYDILL